MKKELKDYLHLYLGCEVLTNEGKGILIAVFNQDDGVISELVSLSDGGDPDSIEWVKPILRLLSDMTEDEFYEFKKLADNDASELAYIENVVNIHTTLFHEFEATRYLLSKGFDIFSLIPAGLAINKTTLK